VVVEQQRDHRITPPLLPCAAAAVAPARISSCFAQRIGPPIQWVDIEVFFFKFLYEGLVLGGGRSKNNRFFSRCGSCVVLCNGSMEI
jgi:hypothetical protein